jgi:hypothetical protein
MSNAHAVFTEIVIVLEGLMGRTEHCNNSLWPGIIKFFPAKKSLVCDIQAGDGKISKLFLQCTIKYDCAESGDVL